MKVNESHDRTGSRHANFFTITFEAANEVWKYDQASGGRKLFVKHISGGAARLTFGEHNVGLIEGSVMDLAGLPGVRLEITALSTPVVIYVHHEWGG